MLPPPTPLPQPVTIAMVGKYTDLSDAYLSVTKALQHACMAANRKLKVRISCAAGWWAERHTSVLVVSRQLQEGATASSAPLLPAATSHRWSGWRRPTWRTRPRRRSRRRTRVRGGKGHRRVALRVVQWFSGILFCTE